MKKISLNAIGVFLTPKEMKNVLGGSDDYNSDPCSDHASSKCNGNLYCSKGDFNGRCSKNWLGQCRCM